VQLAGELSKISLPSLVQLLRNGELTGKVCLTQGANSAFIFVERGRIVHVESDLAQGREALLELFVWMTGSFSFVEADLENVPRTLPADEPVEKVIREGVTYLDQKKFLDHLRITSRTVLSPQGRLEGDPVFEHIDGRTPLAEILRATGMPRRLFVASLHRILSEGKAHVVEPQADDDTVNLPSWVISRLKQDNSDLSQAIIEMVIWVDRVKCWMYQADAELDKIVGELSGQAGAAPGADGEGVDDEGRASASAAATPASEKTSGQPRKKQPPLEF
jgi:hypothetical protein